ncbi:hypothetical protein BDR26DRAFT_848935 [Obelidium mucronatum]|nr:hypothetical protein BDR26DRAFT_848935 [Obelidium mucronatum]
METGSPTTTSSTTKLVDRQQSYLEYSFHNILRVESSSSNSINNSNPAITLSTQESWSKSRLITVQPRSPNPAAAAGLSITGGINSFQPSTKNSYSNLTTPLSPLKPIITPTKQKRGSISLQQQSIITKHDHLVANIIVNTPTLATTGTTSTTASSSVWHISSCPLKSLKAQKRWKWAFSKVKQMVKASNAAHELSAFEMMGFMGGNIPKSNRGTIDSGNGSSSSSGTPRVGGGGGGGDLISGFDSNAFKITMKPGGSDRVMCALIKNAEERNPEDLRILDVLIRNLPLFSKYSPAVIAGLSKVVGYSRFGPRRHIVKEGHPGRNFYYIMSGELDDAAQASGNSKQGMIFGELALLLDNAKRTATSLHPFFQQLGAAAVNHLALTAQTVQVKPGEMILAEGEVPDCIYLICEGEAKISKCVQMAKVRLAKRGTKFKLYPHPLPENVDAPFGMQISPELVHVTVVGSGEYYGAAAALVTGGNPSQIATLKSYFDIVSASHSPFSIVARTSVKYIALNKYSLAKELKPYPDVLEGIAKRYAVLYEYFNHSGIKNVQDLYLERHTWWLFKQKTIKKILLEQDAAKENRIRKVWQINAR